MEQRKMEEKVSNILKGADLEKVSMLNVLTALSEQLNVDFSADDHRKRLVRQVVDSYLLSLPPDDHQENDSQLQQPEPTPKSNISNNSDTLICKLSSNRFVSVQNSGENALVSFSYRKDTRQTSAVRALSLTTDQWEAFRNSVPAIDEAIVKKHSEILSLQSRKRKSHDVGKQIEYNTDSTISPCDKCSVETKQIGADMFSTSASTHEKLIPIDRQHNLDNMPISVTNVASNSQVQHDSVTAFPPPQGLVPIQPCRLNGKNYECWMRQMYFFLNQLNTAYVLTKPCPSIHHGEASSERTVQAKAAERKWTDDDYLCRCHILNSLSDHLFNEYSKKVLNAKELWDELKITFNEDFGTNRSQVNRYIQFQMADGVSVIQQVQELNNIADSIIASGMWIDENFHISTIVSKLPPSWKECQMKLMQEEFLPMNKLIYTFKVEEESRNRYINWESSKNARSVESKLENNVGSKKKEMIRLCYTCGNEGHIAKRCPLRRFADPSNGNENSVVTVTTEMKTVESRLE